MNIRTKTIEELVSIIIMQEREITKLKKKLRQVKQYIEVYEEYIQGEADNGY
jgi:uncharacterized coiled-coil protein SlyX